MSGKDCWMIEVGGEYVHFHFSSLPGQIFCGHGGIFAENRSGKPTMAYIVAARHYHRGVASRERALPLL